MSFLLLLLAVALGLYAAHQVRSGASGKFDSVGQRITAENNPSMFRVQLAATIVGCVVAAIVALAIMSGK